MDPNKGIVLVLSGPSGSGKGTILKKVIEGNKDIIFSISATSRLPRAGEVEAVHYFFKGKEEFETMIVNGDFLEWVTYCDNYYGTPKDFVIESINNGKDIIIEIEVEGALNIKKNFPECVLVFLVPPTYEELRNRILKRGTETEESLDKRLKTALVEIKEAEKYDYVIINDKLENAITSFEVILKAEKNKYNRKKNLMETILKEGMAYERRQRKQIFND